ncbi:hypothetical protein L3V82_12855 [Thiotrichales bacterium 19S3-7]|nr:hypothetical protein [Thiotrichales bacterium 19S3-7]MCF6803062.1 hypothetical protein [Thiotrichales bacterium 19S3-11]
MSTIIAFISFYVPVILFFIKKLFFKPNISFQELNRIRLQLLDNDVDDLTKKYLLEDVFSVFRQPFKQPNEDTYKMLAHIFLAYQPPRSLKLFLSNLQCFKYHDGKLYVLPYFFIKGIFKIFYQTMPYVGIIIFLIFGFAIQGLFSIEQVFSIEKIDPIKGIISIVFIVLATVFILFLISEIRNEIRSTFAIRKIIKEFDLKQSPCGKGQLLFKKVYHWCLKNIKRIYQFVT